MKKELEEKFLEDFISEEDAAIVLQIINESIERMGIKQMPPDSELSNLSVQENYEWLMTRHIFFRNVNENLKCIWFQFVGDKTPIAQSNYYPMEAVWSFLDTARNYFNHPETTMTAEDIEKYSVIETGKMFQIMINAIYPRFTATMHAITDETINEWYRQENKFLQEFYAKQGETYPSWGISKFRNEMIKDHTNEIKDIWKNEGERFKKFQLMMFAKEYDDNLFNHWDTISLLYRNDKDWQAFAKLPGFEDTPEDLLSKLKGSAHKAIAKKALEHAARRANLLNVKCKKNNILEKRKKGIPASGYSETQLYKFLVEGRNIVKMIKDREAINSTPQEMKKLAE
jgi:1,2-phenylacetyl-CoA epoxidase catalytic subunit